MARCNLPMEQGEEYLNKEEYWRHDMEELDKCIAFFQNYLFSAACDDYLDLYSYCPKNSGQEKSFHCSACGEFFTLNKKDKSPIFKAKHKEIVNCPCCGERVEVQQMGRIRSGASLHQKSAVSFINVTGRGAVCIDSGIAFYDFNHERDTRYADMEVSFIAKKRYYIEQGICQGWKRAIGPSFYCQLYGDGEWERTANITEPFFENPLYGCDGFGYVIGLEKLEKSQLRYSAIDRYYLDYHAIDIFEPKALIRLLPQYLAEYALNSRIEMAVKLGLSEAVGELVRDGRKNSRYINWKATEPTGFVRMNKADGKLFWQNPSMDFLRWFSEMKKLGAVKNVQEAQSIAGEVGMVPEEAAAYALKYSVKLSTLAKRMHSNNRLMLWKDYVSMGETLGLDFSREDVLFPKNLHERHDELAKAIETLGNEEKDRLYQKRRKELMKKYGFTMDGLSIVVPEGIEEIVKEGKVLQICVGGYAHRHVEGKTTILFLRHERRPERSFLCIELDESGDIAQIHGYRNERYKPFVNMRRKYAWFLEPWQDWYKNGSRRDKKGRPILKGKRASA